MFPRLGGCADNEISLTLGIAARGDKRVSLKSEGQRDLWTRQEPPERDPVAEG